MKYCYATDFGGPIAYPCGEEPPAGAIPLVVGRLSGDCVCVVCSGNTPSPCICRKCMARARRRMRNPLSVKRAPVGHWEPFAMSMLQDWHERFVGYVDTSADCHVWTHTKNSSGYGMFPFGGRVFLAHRLAFLLSGNDFGYPVVMHKCDNPSCVNPEHLCGGAHTDNMQDMLKKGRRASTKGERNPNAKLSIGEVDDIKWIFSKGIARSEVAKVCGINWSLADDIYSGVHWNG